ncbi:MAG TPA: FkbM family methyltransferase [Mycobacteriales bacterium]|nr:FkbM family methyltransferase [Mycobacteriales bacterium]
MGIDQPADRSIAMRGPIRAIRTLVNRAGFDITREPQTYRFVRILQRQGVTEILDIGANTGQYGEELRAARFAGRIISVEPLADAFATLQRRAARDDQWVTERAAVSDTAGRIQLNVSGNSVSSSVLPMLAAHSDPVPESAYVGVEEVTATTVDELVARHRVDPSHALLKLDIQGYERTALAGAAESLTRLRAVQLELSLTPLYDGQALLPELLELMSRHGFDLWLIEPAFIEPGTGRMLQCDGVFFRR